MIFSVLIATLVFAESYSFGGCIAFLFFTLFLYGIVEAIKWENKKRRKNLEAQEINRKAQEKNRKDEDYARERAKNLAAFQEKSNNFLASPEYKFLQQFTKKYQIKGNNKDFSNLQMLFGEKWNFTIDELKTLTKNEYQIHQLDIGRDKILLNNPSSRREILESYLNHYQSDDNEMLLALADILQQKHLFYRDLDELKSEVKIIEKEIELKNFELRLAEENQQVDLEEVDQLSGYEFEDFLKTLFLKIGYQVEQTKLSGDQGADLVVVKFGEKTVVQAKRFGGKVGNYAVQEIMAAISLYQAQKGMVITNSYYTPAAVELANANNIELVDRGGLEELINKHW